MSNEKFYSVWGKERLGRVAEPQIKELYNKKVGAK